MTLNLVSNPSVGFSSEGELCARQVHPQDERQLLLTAQADRLPHSLGKRIGLSWL